MERRDAIKVIVGIVAGIAYGGNAVKAGTEQATDLKQIENNMRDAASRWCDSYGIRQKPVVICDEAEGSVTAVVEHFAFGYKQKITLLPR